MFGREVGRPTDTVSTAVNVHTNIILKRGISGAPIYAKKFEKWKERKKKREKVEETGQKKAKKK